MSISKLTAATVMLTGAGALTAWVAPQLLAGPDPVKLPATSAVVVDNDSSARDGQPTAAQNLTVVPTVEAAPKGSWQPLSPAQSSIDDGPTMRLSAATELAQAGVTQIAPADPFGISAEGSLEAKIASLEAEIQRLKSELAQRANSQPSGALPWPIKRPESFNLDVAVNEFVVPQPSTTTFAVPQPSTTTFAVPPPSTTDMEFSPPGLPPANPRSTIESPAGVRQEASRLPPAASGDTVTMPDADTDAFRAASRAHVALNQLVTIELVDTPLSQALQSLRESCGVPVILQSGVDSDMQVTLVAENVPLQDVLHSIAVQADMIPSLLVGTTGICLMDANGLGSDAVDLLAKVYNYRTLGVYEVGPASGEVDQLQEMILAMVIPLSGVSIETARVQNKLVIRADLESHRQIAALLKSLGCPLPVAPPAVPAPGGGFF